MELNPPTKHPEDHRSETFLDRIVWLLKGFAFPIWSRPYYRKAAKKPMGTALIFLVLFAMLQSGFSTITTAINLNKFGLEIKEAYATGEIPDITIENGRATVSGSGRYIAENNRQIIAVDTTGAMQEINTNQYSEGFLLTRDEFHLVNEDGYRVLPLSDINDTFGNPIILDAGNVIDFWGNFSLIIDVVVLVGGFFFFSLGRFIYLAVLGLIVWGAASINNKGVDFGKILITGIYANVPTTYLMIILRNIGISFFGLRGFILFVIWGIAIAYVLKTEKTEQINDGISGTAEAVEGSS